MIDDFENIQDDEQDDDLYAEVLDVEKIISNIGKYSSEKLCEMIVCNRYFNFNNELTIHCMKELSLRRQNGDDLDFEKRIEDLFSELPKLDLVMPDLRSMLNEAIRIK